MNNAVALSAALWAALWPVAAARADKGLQGDNAEPVDLASVTEPVVERALSFLEANQQPDGGWLGYQKTDPAITALVAKCFIQSPRYGPQHPIVRRALEMVLSYAKPDGGIYVEGQGLRNYQTSVCLMALAATKDPNYRRRIRAAQEFLTRLQWDEGEGYERSNSWYGGTGYGRNKRPDLSNTQMMLEALKQSGLPPEHPAYKKAIVQRSAVRCRQHRRGVRLHAGQRRGEQGGDGHDRWTAAFAELRLDDLRRLQEPASRPGGP